MHMIWADPFNLKRGAVIIYGVTNRVGIILLWLLNAVSGAFHVLPFAAFLFLDR